MTDQTRTTATIVPSPPASINSSGWASTGRVGRDAAIATLIVGGIVETGLVPPDYLTSHPSIYALATATVTVLVRFAMRFLFRYQSIIPGEQK